MTATTLNASPGILVVDDEEIVRSVMERALQRRGFRVWLAGSGPEAIDVYNVHHEEIDLVVLEVGLQAGMDVLRTVEALRHVNALIRISYMNSYPWDYTAEELLALGGERVFQKPFQPADVAEQLWQTISPN